MPKRSSYFASLQSFEYREVFLSTTDQGVNLLKEGLEKSGKRREKSGNSVPLLEISRDGREGV
jgi:hypothetical protein